MRKLPVAASADVFGASTLLVVFTAAFVAIALPRKRGERDDAMNDMQAVVLRVEEDGRTRTIRAPAPIVIGRAPTATLIVPDAQVSRLHARIDFSDGVLSVRDLDSRNGTLVNARPIDGYVALADGDEIDVGMARIVYCGLGAWK
jgi:pSer/pThr/pTyr-binding forkhead associated (FHA) protein